MLQYARDQSHYILSDALLISMYLFRFIIEILNINDVNFINLIKGISLQFSKIFISHFLKKHVSYSYSATRKTVFYNFLALLFEN